jgi:hypothetical protein
MEKMCILLTGQMRTYQSKQIIDSYHAFLSYGSVDLYIFTWKNKGFSHNHGIHDLNPLQDDIITEEELLSHYSQFKFMTIKKIVIDDFNSFCNDLSPNKKSLYHTPFRDHSSITTSIPIEYKYQQAIQYLSSVETSYSKVMITRPDMVLLREIPFQVMEENIIYFQHPCNRCMDHCWFGTPTTVIKQLYSIYDDYEKNQNRITFEYQNNRDNNELLIYQCLKNGIQIKVTDGSFVRVVHFRDGSISL